MKKAKKSLEQIEAEKLSRRVALGRIGFLAGASAVAALTSDELLRKVGAEMQRRAGDNKVVNQVAKEFQGAGIAVAAGCVAPPWTEDDDCTWEGVFHYCDYHFSCGSSSTAIDRCKHCCESVYGNTGACTGQNVPGDIANCKNRCEGGI